MILWAVYYTQTNAMLLTRKKQSLQKAVKAVQSNVRIVSCRFHLSHAWWRKIQELGVVRKYRRIVWDGTLTKMDLRAFMSGLSVSRFVCWGLHVMGFWRRENHSIFVIISLIFISEMVVNCHQLFGLPTVYEQMDN